MDKRMKVIAMPIEGTRIIFEKKNRNENVPPFMTGIASDSNCINLLCGYCGAVLCESIASMTVTNLVFKCPICNKMVPGNTSPGINRQPCRNSGLCIEKAQV